MRLDLPSLVVGPPDITALRALYVELEFAGLARALGAGAASAVVQAEPPLKFTIVDSIDALNDFTQKARSAGRCAMVTESELEADAPPINTPLRSKLLSLAFCLAPGECYYLPIAHRAPGDQRLLDFDAAPSAQVNNLPPLSDPRMRALIDLLGDAAVAGGG